MKTTEEILREIERRIAACDRLYKAYLEQKEKESAGKVLRQQDALIDLKTWIKTGE